MDEFEEQYEAETALAFGKPGKSKNKIVAEEGQLTIDVYQTDDDIVIQSTIAGVTSDDLDIAVTNDMVTIRGSRKPEDKVRAGDYYYQELYWGSFSRTVILPEDIDADHAKAKLNNGMLTLRLPKLAKTKIKKIKISP